MIRSEANTDDLADSADRIIRQTQALTHVVTEFLRIPRPLELTQETVRLETLVEQVAEEICSVIPDRASIRPTGSFADLAGDRGLATAGVAEPGAQRSRGSFGGGRPRDCDDRRSRGRAGRRPVATDHSVRQRAGHSRRRI